MTASSTAKFLQEARTFVEKAQGSPEIASVLSGYGYPPERLQAILALVAEAEALARRKSVEYGEKHESMTKLIKARNAANVLYVKALKLARVALRGEPASVEALGLSGPRKQSLSGWYEQAGDFYANLLGNPGYVRKLERFGYTLQRLQDERRAVDGVMDARADSSTETSQAKAATAARDRIMDALDDEVSDLRAVCEVAFYETPAMMEEMGPMAPTFRRHAPRRKKPAA